jgi:hypothetical protein
MPELIIISKDKDFHCLYDQEDQELISRFSWSLHSQGYAQTTINGRIVLMHRLILGIVDNPEIETDHRFHNKLDNRRSEIRICNHSQNRRNSRKLMQGSSKYKGVYRDGRYYHSQIVKDQKVVNLGRYRSEVTAGKVYDQEARKEFKDFAFPNFPKMNPLPEQLSFQI